VKTAVAGLAFDIGPDEALSPDEALVIDRLAGTASGPSFHLTVAEGEGAPGMAMGAPADVQSPDRRVLEVRHASFQARLDVWGGVGELRRPRGLAFPLEISLRVAMAARLPLAGGLPLHAAGIVVDGRGVAFFGPSGAGKSTLAGLSPYPVLSDEMIAVQGGDAFSLAASGFWGTFGTGPALTGTFPLAAIVELGKALTVRWEALPPDRALRRLIPSILVPPAATVWNTALAVLGRLVRAVPVYRMEWAPGAPPWRDVARLATKAV